MRTVRRTAQFELLFKLPLTVDVIAASTIAVARLQRLSPRFRDDE
jgi:hypothetical protein